MTKHFIFTLLVVGLAMGAFGQTTRPDLDKVKANPATVENAARADAGLIDKKNLFDSTSLKTISPQRKHRCSKSNKIRRRQTSL